MKLYATTTSERASKGQGGNEYVDITLHAFDKENPIGVISLAIAMDGSGEDNQYLLTWKDATWEDETMILREGHAKEGLIQTAEVPPDYVSHHYYRCPEHEEQRAVWSIDNYAELGNPVCVLCGDDMERVADREALYTPKQDKGNKKKGETVRPNSVFDTDVRTTCDKCDCDVEQEHCKHFHV